MTTINSAVAYTLTQNNIPAAQAASASVSLPDASNNAFGDAVNVTLSAPAQAVVNAQGNPNPAPTATPPSPPVVVSTSTTSDTQTLVEEALQKVIPQVGVTDASEVVDSQGNINDVKLKELLAEQAAHATAVKFL